MKESQQKLIESFRKLLKEERFQLFLEKLEERTRKITIVLEDIYQPRNISASLRSADCFGIQDVHIIENKNPYKKCPNTSLGSEKWLTIKKYSSHEENPLQLLKDKGYKIIATTPHCPQITLPEFQINENKIALLFGTEKGGLSQKSLEESDLTLGIPIYGFTESFNISVSVSLCLQSLVHQMREKQVNWKMSEKEKREVLLCWLKKEISQGNKIESRFKEEMQNLKRDEK